MGQSIASTLALPLLGAALEPQENYPYGLLPRKVQQKIACAYKNAGGGTHVNPVKSEEFYITGDGSQLKLAPIYCNVGNKANE